MRLKYYLRGLGIGMAVTAAVLSFQAEDKQAAMTDEQVIERARELGMQDAPQDDEKEPTGLLSKTPKEPEDTVSSLGTAGEAESAKAQADPLQEPAKQETGQPKTEEAKPSQPEPEAPKTEQPKEETEPEAQPGDAPTQPEEGNESPAAQPDPAVPKVTLIIRSGEGSFTVSKKVEEAGLTDSAAAFDTYLCQNGYDKRLTAGVHEIPVGASQKEIADILTSRNH